MTGALEKGEVWCNVYLSEMPIEDHFGVTCASNLKLYNFHQNLSGEYKNSTEVGDAKKCLCMKRFLCLTIIGYYQLEVK